MKRLKLNDFKTKNLKKEDSKKVDQLLGQVLGDCHEIVDNQSLSLEDTEGQIIKSDYN